MHDEIYFSNDSWFDYHGFPFKLKQASGLYAQTMAERGFRALAFDPSYTGENGGMPRNVASPDINTEDVSAAVDYLVTLSNVDPERIGVIGICGFGGMSLNAAAMDPRIKGTVTSTMYDMSRVNANDAWNMTMPLLSYSGEIRIPCSSSMVTRPIPSTSARTHSGN